jgi:hypothetical protein
MSTMRYLAVLIAAVLAVSSPLADAKSSGSGKKSAPVSSYTRKDGTHVSSYYRAPRGTAGTGKPTYSSPKASKPAPAPKTKSTSHASHTPKQSGTATKRADTGSAGKYSSAARSTGGSGPHKRDPAQRDAFQRTHPCPSTGRKSGECPGYVVDHVVPLKRGGPDRPSNMQWQTVQAAKAKDKVE